MCVCATPAVGGGTPNVRPRSWLAMSWLRAYKAARWLTKAGVLPARGGRVFFRVTVQQPRGGVTRGLWGTHFLRWVCHCLNVAGRNARWHPTAWASCIPAVPWRRETCTARHCLALRIKQWHTGGQRTLTTYGTRRVHVPCGHCTGPLPLSRIPFREPPPPSAGATVSRSGGLGDLRRVRGAMAWRGGKNYHGMCLWEAWQR